LQDEAQAQDGDDVASVDNRTHVSGHMQKTQSKHKKKQSTGNALYRMALEEEERRSRRHKVLG
jgi:hypothetical protein